LLVCAAWGRRNLNGEGERIDVSMADAIAWWIGPHSDIRVTGAERSTGGHPAYGVFRTADDRFLALAPLGEQHLYDGICTALGLDDLVGVPFLERLGRTEEINGAVATAMSKLDADDAFDRLRAAGAPVSHVLTPEEMVVHPQIQARGIVADADGTEVIAFPGILSKHPAMRSGPLPAIGEHTEGFSS
jgi:crotonobetainyl-CoA:carnitine CoA-transferase CaiB-like acyl-CoA transferase